MVDITTEITIRKPVGMVAEYAAEPDNAPQWYVNIKSSAWRTPRPLRVGSQIAFTAQFMGRSLSYVYEIVEYQPEQKLVMRTAQGPFPMETTYSWVDLDGTSTRMTLRNRGEPKGFSRMLAPLLKMAMRKANTKDLKLLKEILEAQPG